MNAFLELAEKQIARPVKARRHRAEQRARDKALRARAQLFRFWQKWHCEQRDALLTGPHSEAAHELITFLQGMTLAQAPELVALVEHGPWHNANSETRYQVLRVIDAGIAALRERADLPPFNDSIPWSDDKPTAFEILRGLLT